MLVIISFRNKASIVDNFSRNNRQPKILIFDGT
jgi:hypothetical protein